MAQHYVQLNLKSGQLWGIQFPQNGKNIPVTDFSHCENFPYVQSESPQEELVPITHCPFHMTSWKKQVSIFFAGTLYILEHGKVSSKLLFSKLDKLTSLIHSSHDWLPSPLVIFVALYCIFSTLSTLSCIAGTKTEHSLQGTPWTALRRVR